MAKAAALRKPKKKVNPLDKDGITYIDYKDTALLRKFISDRGKIRARRVTGVTSQQQHQQLRRRAPVLTTHRVVITASLVRRIDRLRGTPN